MRNIILKSFDGHKWDKPVLERAFRDIEVGTCISIMNDTELQPDIKCKEHVWIPAKPQRAAEYFDTDWSEIEALDADLIEGMRECEATYMRMIERYAMYEEFSYQRRKRQYLQHLRYWNHMLKKHEINLLLLYHAPHQGYDYVLYMLCKYHGIQTINFARRKIMNATYLADDMETAGQEIDARYKELQKEYSDEGKEIPLSPKFAEYFDTLSATDERPWYLHEYEQTFKQKSFLQKWTGAAMRLMFKRPMKFVQSVISPMFWKRKWRQHKTTQLYFKNAVVPDLEKKFVYVPLHLQPEMTTCPLAGAFTDQELTVKLMAEYLPDDVMIYVKEHPAQGELCRSEEFYASMLQLPQVRFVRKDVESHALINNAAAIATGTGTAGLEAIYKRKPVMLFGHVFFQYGPGIYRIHSKEDCKNAVESIFNKGEAPDTHELRLFMKAMEDTAVPYTGLPESKHELPVEERVELLGAAIAKKAA